MSIAFKPFQTSTQNAAREPLPSGSVIDLRGVTRVLRRRWGIIAGTAALVAALAILIPAMMQPHYEATAKIIFDPRPMQVLQNGLQSPSTSSEDTGAEAESQVQVITSAAVLNTVIDQLGLERDPDFGSPPPTQIATMLKLIRDVIGLKAPNPSDAHSTALRRLQQAVTVVRLEKTYILEIRVQTPNIAKSSTIANAVATAFLNETVQNRADATRRSGEALSGRLEELRTRVARSEQAVETFRNSHNLVGVNGKPVLEQQMADASNQLTLAHTRRAEQEARAKVIRETVQRGEGLDSVAEASLSPVLTALKEQLAVAQRQKTAAELVYGPNHPERIAANTQVEAARQRLGRETARLARSAQSDLERARLSETTMAQHLESLKTANAGANDSLVRLRELDREATSDRSVYEAFLNRAKELQERESLDTLDARILTPAVAPLGRSGPSHIVLALAGLVLGGILGIGAALAREQFDDTVRSGQQITAETNIPVIAFIRHPDDINDPGLWALRDGLRAESLLRQPRHVLIGSVGRPASGLGIACNLARSTEYDSGTVALVDAEGEEQSLTRRLKADSPIKAVTPVTRTATLARNALRTVAGIRFLPAGAFGTQGFSNPHEFRAVVDASVGDSKLVVIYGGSAKATARMRALGSVADEIILIVEAGQARLGELQSIASTLAPGDRRLRGIILTGAVDSV